MQEKQRPIFSANRGSVRTAITAKQAGPEYPAPLVIFDVSYLAHRAKWTTGGLSHNGKPTGVIYGVLKQLQTLRRIFPVNAKLIFAWDSIMSKRKDIYPQYKATRKPVITPEEQKMRDEFYQQMVILPEVLTSVGFAHHLKAEGYEADDCIASLAKEFALHYPGKIFVVSSDDDLFQLLGEVVLYRPHEGRNFTRDDLMEKWGVTPGQWIEATAIAGTHNGVPGVRGIGLKTACRYRTTGKLSTKLRASLQEYEDAGIIDRNRLLIELPLDSAYLVPEGFVPVEFELDETGFEKVKEEFGFNMRAEEWS